MSIKQQLQEILAEYASYEIGSYGDSSSPQGLDADEAIQAILDLLDKSLPMLKMAEYSMNGERCVIDENIGWNNAIETVRKVIKEEL